jgi:hypothetical protein
MNHAKENTLSVQRDGERRGSRSNLASIGIHVQQRGETRSAAQKQVRSRSGADGRVKG